MLKGLEAPGSHMSHSGGLPVPGVLAAARGWFRPIPKSTRHSLRYLIRDALPSQAPTSRLNREIQTEVGGGECDFFGWCRGVLGSLVCVEYG
jgi:hypothetical protein